VAGCSAFRAWEGRPGTSAPRPARLDPAEAVAGLLEAHNRARARAGLSPMSASELLTSTAQAHADDMAARRRISHRGSDGSSPFRRILRAGYQYLSAGENVASGQATVAEVMAGWMSSPGHRRNILGRFDEIGAGYATDAGGTPFWCVTFGTPAAGRIAASGPPGVYPFGR
jgi:uncharacterized protein YkwD